MSPSYYASYLIRLDLVWQNSTWASMKTNFVIFYWRRSGVFIANFEHISHLFLVLLLLNIS